MPAKIEGPNTNLGHILGSTKLLHLKAARQRLLTARMTEAPSNGQHTSFASNPLDQLEKLDPAGMQTKKRYNAEHGG